MVLKTFLSLQACLWVYTVYPYLSLSNLYFFFFFDLFVLLCLLFSFFFPSGLGWVFLSYHGHGEGVFAVKRFEV